MFTNRVGRTRGLGLVSLALLVLSGVTFSEEMARIEGVHYKDGKPAPGEIILTYQVSHELNARPNTVQAGTDGKFVFESIRPEEITIGRYTTLTKRVKGTERLSHESSHTRTFFPKAGETLQVDIGKGGRKIIGRMAPKGETDVEIAWQGGNGRYLYSDISWPSPPEGLEGEGVQAWFDEFQKSEEGKALRASSTMILVDVEEDGRFSVSDVPPGKYTLWIEVGDANGSEGDMGVGQAASAVVVPDDGAVEPIDLGTLEVKVHKRLKIGDVAPAFDVPTLDGKSLKLSDLAGKYVLLDFWATWCGPCVGEIPNMKAVYEKFKDNPKFAMVALSLDSEMETVEKFVEKEGLGWTQGFLGEWSKATLPDAYGVRGIPHVFLIGPDGKVVATNLRDAATMDAVAKALDE